MKNIFRKINGLLIIIIALMPVILITTFTITLMTVVNDVKTFVNGPINEINTTLIQVRQTASQAGEAIGKSLEPIKEVNQDIKQALKQVDNLYLPEKVSLPNIGIPNLQLPVKPDVTISGKFPPKVNIKMEDISVTMPTIPGFDIPVPGLKDVKNILENNFIILGQFSEVVGSIPYLEPIREDSQKIVIGVQNLVKDLQTIAIKILALIVLGAMIIIPFLIRLFITPYIKWAHGRVRKGWELIKVKG
jgi:hypothetical protein